MEDMAPATINTSLLNMTDRSQTNNADPNSAEAMKKKIGMSLLGKIKKAKVIEVESIYNCT